MVRSATYLAAGGFLGTALLPSAVQAVEWMPPPKCEFSVEMTYLQDFSSSYRDDKVITASQLVAILNSIHNRYPSSKTALGTFVDKPLEPFGYPYQGPWFDGDWCLDVSHPFGHGLSVEDLVAEFYTKQDGGGNDWAENQLGALHDITRGNKAGWSSADFTPEGMPIARLVVMSTDYMYHIAGDGFNSVHNLRPNDGDGETDCTGEDYPTIQQVRDAVQDRGAFLAFLVGENDAGEDVLGAYEELFDAIGVNGGVYRVTTDTDALVAAFARMFTALEEQICALTLDVVFSQDLTYSYTNDMPNFQSRMGELMGDIGAKYEKTRFGFTSFADKPVSPFGHGPSGDFCYRQNAPLTMDKTAIIDVASKLRTVSGIDWPESQLDAIISSSLDTSLGWRTEEYDDGLTVVRILMVATDAGYHIEGDAAKQGLNLAVHDGSMRNPSKCLEQDYPSIQQVSDALGEIDIHPVFVPTSDIARIYRRLLNDLEGMGHTGSVVELADFGGDLVMSTHVAVDSLMHKIIAKHIKDILAELPAARKAKKA